MNEALRAYIKKQCDHKMIADFSERHGINRISAARFAKGIHTTVGLANYENIIREMVLKGEFDINKWIKEGECDD